VQAFVCQYTFACCIVELRGKFAVEQVSSDAVLAPSHRLLSLSVSMSMLEIFSVAKIAVVILRSTVA